MSASAAQVRKWVAPQTGSMPSMKDDSGKPNTSIVMPHGESFTPSSRERSISSSIDATPCYLNWRFIIVVAIGVIPGNAVRSWGIGTGIGMAGLPVVPISSLRSFWRIFSP